jgi:hypothetical protein
MTDGGLLQDTIQMKLDVLSTMHFIAEAWILIGPTTNNHFVKCSFLTDHVSSNDESEVKLSEDDWQSVTS